MWSGSRSSWQNPNWAPVLFHVITPRLSALLSWGYSSLSLAQKTEWHSRMIPGMQGLTYEEHLSALGPCSLEYRRMRGDLNRNISNVERIGQSRCGDVVSPGGCVSTIHALVVGGLALYILWFDDNVNRDRIWGDPRLVKVNIAIASGYLINDLVLLLWHWKTLGDRYFISHHLAALYAYQYVLVSQEASSFPHRSLARGLLPYFANFRLIAELSTPFVNQRWFFEVLGFPRSTRLVLLNGMAMSVSFFLVRIAVIPSYYQQVASSFGTAAFHRLGLGPQCAWIISSVALDILNTIWMYKIARGCWKILSTSHKHRKTELSKSF
ncbi:TLC domain-containing protein 4-B-like isoform X3 [Pristis pectinata]|uniref:TLC domain-containing protein 4-B-like isoform X3 n=1 Tax=Pristis pectinata TaxID=685728 RepID=UPI00223CEEC8|nr:TLC domain-containing protein 4-B-like isoform X3 [Pristis pectinata]